MLLYKTLDLEESGKEEPFILHRMSINRRLIARQDGPYLDIFNRVVNA